jgi:hypothetical protein
MIFILVLRMQIFARELKISAAPGVIATDDEKLISILDKDIVLLLSCDMA